MNYIDETENEIFGAEEIEFPTKNRRRGSISPIFLFPFFPLAL